MEDVATYDDIMKWLREGAGRFETKNQLCEFLGLDASQKTGFYKQVKEGAASSIQARRLFEYLDKLGASVVLPDDEEAAVQSAPREVCFISPRMTGVAEYDGIEAHVQPDADNYVAVPLVEQRVAAGPGLIPEHNIEDWMIVYTPALPILPSMRSLAAVRIGSGQTSMVPTLHPGDICLVDRRPIQDEPRPPGNIYLVQEPVEAEGESPALAIKRVVFEHGRKDLRIQFYSDNAVEHPPRSYGLKERYDGDIHRAIVGRVVWAWTDVTRK